MFPKSLQEFSGENSCLAVIGHPCPTFFLCWKHRVSKKPARIF